MEIENAKKKQQKKTIDNLITNEFIINIDLHYSLALITDCWITFA